MGNLEEILKDWKIEQSISKIRMNHHKVLFVKEFDKKVDIVLSLN